MKTDHRERRARVIAGLLLAFAAASANAAHAQGQAPQRPSAQANEPKVLGRFEGWAASQVASGANKICYAVAKPAKSEGRYARRGEVYAVITHRPAQRQRDEVSVNAGYTYKQGAPVMVEIGDKKFELFTKPDYDPEAAWAPDPETDKAMIEAMIRGRTMVVKGVSSRGTETVDSFSLAGFSKAYQEIGKACGIR